MLLRRPRPTLFPTRRSSDLVETSDDEHRRERVFVAVAQTGRVIRDQPVHVFDRRMNADCLPLDHDGDRLRDGDRKSTRLNSSHMSISYAVFCLKKKNNEEFA